MDFLDDFGGRAVAHFGHHVRQTFFPELLIVGIDLFGHAIAKQHKNVAPIQGDGGFLVLLGFAYAMSWLMAQVGLMVRTPEVVNNASFIVIFPITFVANTFVPLETFPSVLRTFAEWNPVSSVVQAARELFGNSFGAPDVWSLQNPVLYSALWGVAILVVFVPLSVRTYRNTASR